jgi:guanylate kinase
MNKGIILIISGPAGSGKGTIVKHILEKETGFNLSVSLTTRSPRPGEVDGVSYFFVSREEFKKRLDEGGVLEYTEYCGNFYGTPADYVKKLTGEGKNVILEIETDGAQQIKSLMPESVTVFIVPESKEKIRERLVGRGTETPEVVEKRLKKAEKEIEIAKGYDYVVVNETGNSEKAASEVIAIAKAERCKVLRNIDFLNNF